MTTAAKEFSPQLNKLFAESFYEVGWLPRPEGAAPGRSKYLISRRRGACAGRSGTGGAGLSSADLEGAWQLLDQVDVAAPNQAVPLTCAARYCSTQGKTISETALRNALAADPQLLAARYNLARVPLGRKTTKLRAKNWRRSSVRLPAAKNGRGTVDPVSDFSNAPVGRPRRRGAESDG